LSNKTFPYSPTTEESTHVHSPDTAVYTTLSHCLKAPIHPSIHLSTNNTTAYHNSCIHQMKYHTCKCSSKLQTGELRLKEHIRHIISKKPQSAYAICILFNTHEYGPTETTKTLLQLAHKDRCMNVLENYFNFSSIIT